MGLGEFLKSIFKKRVLIYSAIGPADYFKIADRLKRQGIKYKTKFMPG